MPANARALSEHWPAALLLVFVVVVAIAPVHSIDLWFHLAIGKQIATEQRIPTTDSFSHTAKGEPFVPHEWLSQLLFYEIYRVAGGAGLLVLKVVLAVLAFALIYVLIWWRCGVPLAAAALTALVTLVARGFLDWRPMMISLVLFAGLLLLVERARVRPPNLIWWSLGLFALFVLWINLHGVALGGVTALVLLLGAEAVALWLGLRSAQRAPHLPSVLALAVVASTLGCLVSPRGYHALLYPFELATSELTLKNIVEWRSPDFQQWEMWALEAVLLLGLFLLVVARGERRLSDAVLLVAFAHAALISRRHGVLFSVVAASAYAAFARPALADLRELLRGPYARVAWGSLGLSFAVLVGMYAYRNRPGEDLVRSSLALRYLPEKCVEYIAEEPLPPQLFNLYEWGGYLMWFAPGVPVFMDGRTDVYMGGPLDDYMVIWQAQPGWDRLLAKYDVGHALVRRRSPLRKAMLDSGEWREVCHDDVGSVLVRKSRPPVSRPLGEEE